MPKNDATASTLSGTGAAYIRVSTDQQDTERQYAAIREFERRHSVTIAPHHSYKDVGWARDADKLRPEFNRLLDLAKRGAVKWIVVDRLDRFGTKNAKRLFGYLADLEDCGCRLFDGTGKDWTAEDAATEITAWLAGRTSTQEQLEKSHRVLGGKAAKARAGEWQGGPVRLGFDVVCYHRETGKELWRVIFEARSKRLRVFPNGERERFDGEKNFPKCQPLTEVMRVAPSKDKAEIAAVVSVFQRFATESVSCNNLAHFLNGLGYRHSFGGMFHGHHIERMLEDPIFLGYYTWNKTHHGKFHRFADGKTLHEDNGDEKVTRNEEADWVQSQRLFDPLIDLKTWDAVQQKLRTKEKRTKAPRSSGLYLSGLVFCGGCGGRMVSGPTRKHSGRKRFEYMCGTYHRFVTEGQREQCQCLRNGVFQDELESYVACYLEESGKRLELLTAKPEGKNLTSKLQEQKTEHWVTFCEGVGRLEKYLAKYHPEEYKAIVHDDIERETFKRVAPFKGNAPPGTLARHYGKQLETALEKAKKSVVPPTPTSNYVRDLLSSYQSRFDPVMVEKELKGLQTEHEKLVESWSDLPTKRAKEVATVRLEALETRIEELEKQRDDASELVLSQYRAMDDLLTAIADANRAMRGETGEQALRQKTQAIRGVIQRIECSFTATGKKGGGPGRQNAKLATVRIYPVSGTPLEFPAEQNVLEGHRVVSR